MLSMYQPVKDNEMLRLQSLQELENSWHEEH